VRLIRLIVSVAVAAAILCTGTSLCSSMGRPRRAADLVVAEQHSEANDIGDYYGFGQMELVKLDWGIQNLVVTDFDKDGRNDIAIVNNSKARIELLIQKEHFGPGEPETTVDQNDVDINIVIPPTRFDNQNITVSQKIYAMACGDLNSDGLVDLAFYGEPRGLYVMLQRENKPETGKKQILQWRTRKKINIEDGLPSAHSLLCADIDNDDANDLVLAGPDGIYIILQKKDGSLAEPVKYPCTARVLGVDVADLNGDGLNDIIILTDESEKPIQVRFGQQGGQLGPQVQLFIEQPWVVEFADIDAQPGQELLAVDAVSKRLVCYKFEPKKEKDGDWPILFYPLASGEGSAKRDLVIGDLNADGLADVVISEPGAAELVVYKQASGTGLTEPVRFPGFTDIQRLSSADIDGDGRIEVGVLSIKEKVIGISKFENDRLSFPRPVKTTGEPVAMGLADADADGAIDCVYVSRSESDIRSLRVVYNITEQSEDVNSVGEPNEQGVVLKKLASNPDGLKVVDVDQDGLPDVLIFVKYELPILVRQTAKRSFEVVEGPGAQAALLRDASVRSVAVADVDGNDGREVLLAQDNFARSMLFSKQQGWRVIDQYNAKSTENKVCAAAAFVMEQGQSGRPAILLLDGQKGQLQVLRAGEDGTYRFENQVDVGKWNAAAGVKMAFEKLTGGETKSILLFDGEKFAITTPSAQYGGQRLEQKFAYATKIKDGMYGNVAAGDINSDGVVDIILVDYKGNHIEILVIDSAGKCTSAMRFKVFEQKSYRESSRQGQFAVEPREMKVADVTGDGKNDLVAVIHDRLIIYPQD